MEVVFKDIIQGCDELNETSRRRLLNVLAVLEGEMQARDVALGALKSERFKETLAFAENHRGSFAQDPSLALQRDSLVTRAQAEKTRGASEASDTNDPCSTSLHTQLSKYRMALRKSLSCLKESESLREASQEEIKVLQTTIQAQHEELKQKENDTIDHSEDTSNKADETLETVKKALEEEKRQKLQLVMLLLHDRRQIAMRLLEERRRTDELSRRLRNESLRTKTLASELEEESQRSLALEAEVEACGRRIDETKKVLGDEKRKHLDLEEALRRSKQEADHLRKQLAEAHRVAMSQASTYMQHDTGSLTKTMQPTKLKMTNDETKDLKGGGPAAAAAVPEHMYMTQNRPPLRTKPQEVSSGVKKVSTKGLLPPPVPPNKPTIVREANSDKKINIH